MTAGICEKQQGAPARRPRLGVSACLLGHPVRYDGGHCRREAFTTTWSRFVEWVPLCPEIEAGLGAPREALRLVARARAVRVETRSGSDVTDRLATAVARLLSFVGETRLDGVVLKNGSPSCGLWRVRVHGQAGSSSRDGRGVFASALVDAFDMLPVEEEARLFDPGLRDQFLVRVFAHARLQALVESSADAGALSRFHAGHKLLLLAHSPEHCRLLGRLVAQAGRLSHADLLRRYSAAFMAALSRPSRRGRHVNALQHAAGFFKSRDALCRDDLHDAIGAYARGAQPRDVPLRLLGHYARECRVQYIAHQWYLRPYPREMFWAVAPPGLSV